MHPEAETRLPKRGEGWRHWAGHLYEIVGTGHDSETGHAVVIYTNWGWSLAQAPNLWSRPLHIFLGFTDEKSRRFRFEREPERD